jgi:hypothetical protein
MLGSSVLGLERPERESGNTSAITCRDLLKHGDLWTEGKTDRCMVLVMWDFVVDKVALGQVSSEHFGFPLPVFILSIYPQTPSPIIWGWYNRPVSSGRSVKSPTPIIIIINRRML